MLFLRNPTQGLDLKKKCAWCYGHSLRCSSIPVCPRGRARGSNPGTFVGFESFFKVIEFHVLLEEALRAVRRFFILDNAVTARAFKLGRTAN